MRTFVAIDLPEDLRASLADLALQIGTGRPVPEENLHLTLVFLGDASDPELEDLHSELAGLTTPNVEIAITGLDLYGDLPHPRLIAARVDAAGPLKNLQASVARAARKVGFDVPHRRFRPHVTLARFGRSAPADPIAIDRFFASFAGFRVAPKRVRTLGLYESRLRAEGAEYAMLAGYHLVQTLL